MSENRAPQNPIGLSSFSSHTLKLQHQLSRWIASSMRFWRSRSCRSASQVFLGADILLPTAYISFVYIYNHDQSYNIHLVTCLLVYGFIHVQSLLYDLVCLLLRVCVYVLCVCFVSVLCVCACISMYIIHIYIYYIVIYAHHRLTVFSAFWLFIISGIRLWGGDASSRCSRSRLWRSRSSCFLASPAHSVCTCSNSDTNLWKPTHIITHHHTSSHTIKRHHHTASYIVKQPHTSTHPPQWSDALRTHGRSFHLYRAELYNSWE